MHKIILIVSFLLTLNHNLFTQNFWEKVKSPTTKLLNSIVFTDSLNGWVAGDSGLIIHTSNGGVDWETQYANDSLNAVNTFFLNDQFGWCSAWSNRYAPFGTYILKTSNGGLDWSSERFRIPEVFVNSVYFLDSLTGFAVGYPGIFHRTTDGGSTWSHVELDSSTVSGFPAITIRFYSSLYGYACGGIRDVVGIVWRTCDGGISWTTVVDTLTSEPLYDIQIIDSLNIIAMGGDPEFGTSQVVSTDGGNTWEYSTLGIFYYPVSVGFRTAGEGWVPMGEQRKFLYTSDFGDNWTVLITPDSSDVIRICFPDSIHGYGISISGDIVKYNWKGPNNFAETENTIPEFYLQQNYPNPFNPVTKIEYSIPEQSAVKLIVYNTLGEKVAFIVDKILNAGRYEVDFNATNLPSGIYLYSLTAGSYAIVKKMILLK